MVLNLDFTKNLNVLLLTISVCEFFLKSVIMLAVQVRMKRIYEHIKKGDSYTLIQCGWICPDCSQLKKTISPTDTF